MNTAEKIQSVALVVFFLFLAYATFVAVDVALQEKNAQRPVPQAGPPAAVPEPRKAAPPKKAKAPKRGAKLAKDDTASLISSGRRKATAGDCAGASADFRKAAALDASLKTGLVSELDSCRSK